MQLNKIMIREGMSIELEAFISFVGHRWQDYKLYKD